MTRPILAIHGISEKRNAAGFSMALRRLVIETVHRHNTKNADKITAPAWEECVWSDLSDLPDRPVLAPLDLFLDVYRYNEDPALRLAVSDRVRPMLTRDTVVVAHSLGSIVMIEELIRAAHAGEDRPCAALLTLGSPGGLNIGLEIKALGLRLDIDWRRHGMTLRDYADTLRDWGIALIDVWCPGDIVHTGKIPAPIPAGKVYGCRGLEAHYPFSSLEVNGGTHPVGAHIHYWRNPFVSGIALDLATSKEGKDEA